eukprot:scaffold1504_cov417-Prasinococcus_capsulatus_cf.AAC.82
MTVQNGQTQIEVRPVAFDTANVFVVDPVGTRTQVDPNPLFVAVPFENPIPNLISIQVFNPGETDFRDISRARIYSLTVFRLSLQDMEGLFVLGGGPEAGILVTAGSEQTYSITVDQEALVATDTRISVEDILPITFEIVVSSAALSNDANVVDTLEIPDGNPYEFRETFTDSGIYVIGARIVGLASFITPETGLGFTVRNAAMDIKHSFPTGFVNNALYPAGIAGMTIQGADQFGNLVTTVDSTGIPEVDILAVLCTPDIFPIVDPATSLCSNGVGGTPIQVTQQEDGLYSLQVSLVSPGSYSLSITYEGELLGSDIGSPDFYVLTVEAITLDAEASTFADGTLVLLPSTQPPVELLAGQIDLTIATIGTTAAGSNVPLRSGGLTVTVTLTDFAGQQSVLSTDVALSSNIFSGLQVSDLQNGLYVARVSSALTPLPAGLYTVSITISDIGLEPAFLGGVTEFAFRILAGGISFRSKLNSVSPSGDIPAGSEILVSIQARDFAGSEVTSVTQAELDSISVGVSGQDVTIFSVLPPSAGDSVLIVSLSAPLAVGTYLISIRINGIGLELSADEAALLTVNVVDAGWSGTISKDNLNIREVYEVGPVEFLVTLTDPFGNPVQPTGIELIISLSGPGGYLEQATTVSLPGGLLQASFLTTYPTRAGDYALDVQYQSQTLFSSAIVVSYGPPSVLSSLSAVSTTVNVGEEAVIEVQARSPDGSITPVGGFASTITITALGAFSEYVAAVVPDPARPGIYRGTFVPTVEDSLVVTGIVPSGPLVDDGGLRQELVIVVRLIEPPETYFSLNVVGQTTLRAGTQYTILVLQEDLSFDFSDVSFTADTQDLETGAAGQELFSVDPLVGRHDIIFSETTAGTYEIAVFVTGNTEAHVSGSPVNLIVLAGPVEVETIALLLPQEVEVPPGEFQLEITGTDAFGNTAVLDPGEVRVSFEYNSIARSVPFAVTAASGNEGLTAVADLSVGGDGVVRGIVVSTSQEMLNSGFELTVLASGAADFEESELTLPDVARSSEDFSLFVSLRDVAGNVVEDDGTTEVAFRVSRSEQARRRQLLQLADFCSIQGLIFCEAVEYDPIIKGYRQSIALRAAGLYQVDIGFRTQGDTAFRIRTRNIMIEPGVVSAQRSTVLEVPTLVAGVPGTGRIQLLDSLDNVVDLQEVGLQVQTDSSRVIIAVESEGFSVGIPLVEGILEYQVELTAAGQYALEVLLDGQPVEGSLSLFVNAGPPDPIQSTVFGPLVAFANLGQTNFAFVELRDSYSNLIAAGQSGSIEADGTVAINTGELVPLDIATPVWDPANQYYRISVEVPALGSVVLSLSINGERLSVLQPETRPPPITGIALSGVGLSGSISGQRNRISVQVTTDFGPIRVGGEQLFVTIINSSGGSTFSGTCDETSFQGQTVACFLDNSDGVYFVDYLVAEVGAVTVTIGLTEIATAQTTIQISVLDPDSVRAVDLEQSLVEGMERTIAGLLTSLLITFRDADGIALSSVPDNAVITVEGLENSGLDGDIDISVAEGASVRVQFKATVAANFEVGILVALNGEAPQLLPDMPLLLTVDPGPSASANSLLVGVSGGQQYEAEVGRFEFQFQARDEFGNNKNYGIEGVTDAWIASATPSNGGVAVESTSSQADTTGIVTVSLPITVAGDYVVRVTLDGEPITAGASFDMYASSGPVSGEATRAGGSAIAGVRASEDAAFYVSPRDQFNNPVTSSTEALACTIVFEGQSVLTIDSTSSSPDLALTSGAPATCSPNEDCNAPAGLGQSSGCRLLVVFNIKVSGTYVITIIVNNVPLSAVYGPLLVGAGEISAVASTVEPLPGAQDSAAFEDIVYFITPRDSSGNPAIGEDSLVRLTATLLSPSGLPTNLQIFSTGALGEGGLYEIRWRPSTEGTWSVDISLGSAGSLAESPYRVTISPPKLNPALSFIYGEALTEPVQAGAQFSLFIQGVARGGEYTTDARTNFEVDVNYPSSQGQQLTDFLATAPIVLSRGGGVYEMVFTPIRVLPDGGEYTYYVYALVDGSRELVDVESSPHTFTVNPGAISPPDCELSTATSAGTVGVPFRYEVKTFDMFGNPGTYDPFAPPLDFGVTVNGPGGCETETPSCVQNSFVVDRGDGTYQPSVVAVRTGTYSFTLFLNNYPLGGGPQVFQLFAAASDPSRFTAAGPMATEEALALRENTFFVEPRDRYGNRNTADTGSLVSALQDGLTINAMIGFGLTSARTLVFGTVAFIDQKYAISATLPGVGTARVTVSVNGVEIMGSPFEQRIMSGDVDVSWTTASGPGLEVTILGDATSFTIEALDNLGQPVLSQSVFSVSYSPAVSLASAPAVPNPSSAPNIYRVSYTPRQSGLQEISVSWNGQPILGSPFQVRVLEPSARAPLDPTLSRASGEGLEGSQVGFEARFVIELVDQNGAVYAPSENDNVAVAIAGDGGEVPPSWQVQTQIQIETSTILCTYRPQQKGVYTITILLGDSLERLGGEGPAVEGLNVFTMTAFAGASVPAESDLGFGLDGSMVVPESIVRRISVAAGVRVFLYVLPRDENGDSVGTQQPPERVEVSVVGPDSFQETATPIDDGEDRIYWSQVTARLAGIYELTALLEGQLVSLGGIFLEVTAAALDLASTRLFGSGLSGGVVNVPSTITIELFDRFSNRYDPSVNVIALTLEPSETSLSINPLIPGISVPTSNGQIFGQLQAEYSVSFAALYTVGLTVDDEPSQLPVPPVEVRAGPVHTQRCIAIGLNSDGVYIAGQGYTFTVYAYDISGNRVVTGGVIFTGFARAAASTSRLEITDLGDGSYAGTFTPSTSEQYSIEIGRGATLIHPCNPPDVCSLATGGDPANYTPGTPYVVSVIPGSASALTSDVFGLDGSSPTVAGSTLAFQVRTRDANGNDVDEDTDIILWTYASIQETFFGSMDPVVGELGLYEAQITPTRAGDFSISVTIGGLLIPDVPGGSVTPGPPLPEATTLARGNLDSIVAGAPTVVSVSGNDAFGNPVLDMGQVSFLVDGVAFSTSEDGVINREGFVQFTFVNTAVGLHSLSYTLQGTEITVEGGFSIVAGKGSASDTLVSGWSAPCTAGDNCRFGVVGRDIYGNVAPDSISADALTVTVINGNVEISLVISTEPALIDEVSSQVAGNPLGLRVTYTSALSGTAILVLIVGGNPVLSPSGQPYSKVISAGPIDLESTLVSLPGAAIQGVPSPILIRALDGNGNQVTLDLSDSFGFSFILPPSLAEAGVDTSQTEFVPPNSYVSSFTPPVSASAYSMTVQVTFDEDTAFEAPINVLSPTTYQQTLSASNCVILDSQGIELLRGQVASYVAGSNIDIVLLLRDENGIRMQESVQPVPEVTLNAGTVQIVSDFQESSPDTWRATLRSRNTGTSEIQVSINGIAVSNSGFVIEIMGGEVDVSRTVVTGTGIEAARAGVETSVSVSLFDSEGNPPSTEQLLSIVVVGDFDGARVEASPIGGGLFDIRYTPEVLGNSPLAITVGGLEVPGSPFTVTVSAGPYVVANTITSTLPEEVDVAEELVLSVQGRDANLNIVSEPIPVEVASLPTEGVAFRKLESITSENGVPIGRTDIFFSFTRLGSYSIQIYVNGVLLTGEFGSLSVRVISTLVAPELVRLTGEGTRDFVASGSKMRVVRAEPVDTFGNLVSGVQVQFTVVATLDFQQNDLDALEQEGISIEREGEVDSSVALLEDGSFEMSFLAVYPGEYNLTVAMRSGNAASSDYTVVGNGFPLTVRANRRDPPILLHAQLSDRLSEVVMTFSVPTNRASMTALQGCGAVLDEELLLSNVLGVDPRCGWISDMELSIFLGASASVSPRTTTSTASRIILRNQALYTRRRNSFSASGSALVVGPENPPAVRAVLVGPEQVGACGDVTLDGSSSVGSGGRAFRMQFSVQSTSSIAAIQSILRASGDASVSQFIIPGSLLEYGVAYTFTLRVENFLGDIGTDSLVVVRRRALSPVLSLLGPVERTMSMDVVNTIEAVVTAADVSCEDGISLAQDTGYSISGTLFWDQVSGPSLDWNQASLAASRRAPTLILTPDVLRPGQTYQLSMTFDPAGGTEADVQSIDVTFTTEVASLVIDGALGPSRLVGNAFDLVVEANPKDPSNTRDEYGLAYPWVYEWSCVLVDGNTPCFSTSVESLILSEPAAVLDGILTIPAVHIPVESFEVVALISKEPLVEGRVNRRASVVLLRPQNEDTLVLSTTINPATAFVESASTEISLTCQATSAEPLTYQWRVIEGAVVGTEGLNDLLFDLYSDTPSAEPTIRFRPGAFSVGEHVLECEAASGDGATGVARATVVVNLPPRGGRIKVEPVAGREAVDVFQISALDWTDSVNDLPLRYTFYRRQLDAEGEAADQVVLATLQEAPSLSLLLPAGSHQIQVVATDKFGSDSIAAQTDVIVTAFDPDDPVTGIDALQAKVDTSIRLEERLNELQNIEEEDATESPPISRRRQLLQVLQPQNEAENIAYLLYETIFRPAIAAQDIPTAFLFVDIWSREFGKVPPPFTSVPVSTDCVRSDLITQLKSDIIRGLSALDARAILSSPYIRQFVCGISRLTFTPSEIDLVSQNLLFVLVKELKLDTIVRDLYGLQEVVSLDSLRVGPSQDCFGTFISNLLRITESACFEALPGLRNQTRIEELASMIGELGDAISFRLAPGQGFEAVDALGLNMVSTKALLKEFTNDRAGTIRRDSDVSGTAGALLPTGGRSVEFAANITDSYQLASDSIVQAVVFQSAISLIAGDVEDDRVYLEDAITASFFIVNTTGDGDALSESIVFEPLNAEADIVYTDFSVDDPDRYKAGVRYWNGSTWTPTGVEVFAGPDRVRAHIINLENAQLIAPYDELRPFPPPIYPPPPIYLPPPPQPPLPVIYDSAELDVGVVVGPVVIGIGLCSYMIYLFARRRRVLHEMQLELVEESDHKSDTDVEQPWDEPF